jgi:hypothetical protein
MDSEIIHQPGNQRSTLMKYRRTLVAAILALAASSASASAGAPDVVVGLDQSCPAGTTSRGLSYTWEGGRFVRDGRVCEDLHGKN